MGEIKTTGQNAAKAVFFVALWHCYEFLQGLAGIAEILRCFVHLAGSTVLP